MVEKRKADKGLKASDPCNEKFNLYMRMIEGKASAHDLVRLSFLREMITAEQYADFLEIEKDCEEEGN